MSALVKIQTLLPDIIMKCLLYSALKNYLVGYPIYIKNVNCIQDMMLTLFMSATEKKKKNRSCGKAVC